MIPISKPMLGDEEFMAVRGVLASGQLAQGPRVAEFERAFAAFVGVRHAIATSSGTTALHAALLAHGIGPGDEVITSPFTFMASVNAILYTGATPILVDIDDSFNLDPARLEAAITERTRAILPVHLYGQPADMEAICRVAQRYDLVVVEDACQAHGAEFAGHKVGSFGTGCFSFYATKNMTTGEGGMITTDDDDLATRTRQIINHGMQRRYQHEILGYNYRMTETAAAIGIVQLGRLPAFQARRAEIAAFYDRTLDEIEGLLLPRAALNRSHVYHQYTLRVTPHFGHTRDEVANALTAKGIGVGIYYPVPAHRQPSLAALGLAVAPLPVAEQMAREVLSIPVHPALTVPETEFIAETLASLQKPA
ncbi:MAG TPA: DegT/DnrJ/EryC1/StrS family aminotransferase [Ardenticatenaceae bacterium]|nr:DegT/DnrJ/EryC1/StrS family aminotransferase [Ardenticatenaceae bacterium]